MRVREFEEHLRSYRGTLNADEGIVFGDANAEVRSAQVCWMATADAIRNAAQQGADLILSHEALTFPHPRIRSGIPPTDHLSWPVNRVRLGLLSGAGISVIRMHGSMDHICIHDEFAKALGLPASPAAEEGLARTYDIEPTTLGPLVEDIKEKLSLDAVRVGGFDPDRPVKRVGLAWGGTGLFTNVAFQARILRQGPDALIGGESDACGFLFALDAGVPFIETGHAVSENMGVKAFAGTLSKDLPELRVSYYENPRPWAVR